MTKIVKEADFNNYEDDHRVVQLSASYGQWSFTQMLVVLSSSWKCNLQRVTERGKVKQWDMSIAEMDALCDAWTQFKADLERHKNLE